MVKYKKTIFLFLCVLIQLLGCFYPIIFILRATDIVSIEWYGFGVDSEGYIYIGRPSEICVYKEGLCIRTIDIPQYRSYYFTINDSNILLASSSRVYIFDLNGMMLSKELDPSGSAYSDLQWMREVRTPTGTLYRRTHRFFRDAIEKEDGTVVYQMPMGDYLAKILYYLGGGSLVIFGIKMLLERRYHKM